MPVDATPLIGEEKPPRGAFDCLKAAFRVDLSPRLDANALDAAIAKIPTQTREGRFDIRLAEFAHVTEGAIRHVYSDSGDPYWSEQKADRVVLVIKLGLALSHAGLASVECEAEMRACAEALGLPRGSIDVGFRMMTITFGTGTAHTVTVDEGFAIHQLNDLHELAKCLQANFSQSAADDEEQYLLKFAALIDSVAARPPIYGPLLVEMADTAYRATAVLAVFDGMPMDVLLTALLSVLGKLAMRLGTWLRVPEGLASFNRAALVGFAVPLVSFALGIKRCRLPTIYISLLVSELPGSNLLLGAYELSLGNLVGASRMVRCIANVAYLGLALSMGWVVYGIVDDPNRTEAFTLPTSWCDASASHWLVTSALYQLPFGLLNYVLSGMRLREIPLCLLYFVLTTTLAGALMEYVPQFPSFVGNVLIMFLGGMFACFHEFWSGVPYTVPLTPIFLNLAPGLPALVAIVEHMNAIELGQAPNSDPWLDLLMQGVTYGLGASLAIELWRPVLSEQRKQVVRATLKRLQVVKSFGARKPDGDGARSARKLPGKLRSAFSVLGKKESLLSLDRAADDEMENPA